MAQRHGLKKSGVRQLACRAAGGLWLGVLLTSPIVGAPNASFAQAHEGEEDMSLDFVKQQLARVRAGTPAAGEGSSGQALQDENARLLAEESALLNQISGKDAALGTEAVSAKASVDVDKAIDALTDPKANTAIVATNDSEIEEVRGAIPAVGQAAVSQAAAQKAATQNAGAARVVKASDTRVSPEAPVVEAKTSAKELPALTKPVEVTPLEDSEENPVELLLASQDSTSQPARALQAPRAEDSVSDTDSKTAMSKTSAGSVNAPKISDAEARLESQQASLANLQRTNGDLRRQLETFQRKLREATKELEESRNRLMIAETEVERLSISLEQRNRNNLARVAPGVGQVQPVRAYRAPQQASAPAIAPQQRSAAAPQRSSAVTESTKVKADMLVATVVADKANLRSGAGKNNSPLMTVSRGTRLAVETRTGDWYRVITPTGTRAWVNSEVLSFGPDNQASPTRTVRMSGVMGDERNVTLTSSNR